MKRSTINLLMQDAVGFMASHQFHLPPFAFWSPETWECKGPEVAEIVRNDLGWDITDFGGDDFERCGLLLFTLRNGHPSNWDAVVEEITSGEMSVMSRGTGKLYAEKIMIVGVEQVTPLHFHWAKSEDIINRGGGKLMIQLYNATEDEELDDTPVTVSMDGVRRTVEAGGTVVLSPGESITLPTRLYHKFWGVEDRVLVGEVSMVNDDDKDNRFYEAKGRFPEIEEDEAPLYLLLTDYARYYRGG
ncbi:MAG: D-lyxose/D-mannose family sugar isomerase [Anaerolineae bacterium]